MPPATGADTSGGDDFDRVAPVDLNTEMQRSYIEYAMSVIVSRALPDVRDGFKPVHRRIIYAMYDGGYRPDRGYNKCQRVVGEVMGQYHPHGDSAIYDALVRLVQPWVMRYPLVQGQGNFGNAGLDGAAAARYTECRMDPLAMEMVRDIREDTVDFSPNYDGKNMEPDILPARIPNLLINGSNGIAVGMATLIPPHNLREVADAAQWVLAHPEASKEERLEACMRFIKGPDFPTAAQIVGRSGIEDAYRTGRGSITMRAKVEVEEIEGRTCLVATELPYMTNPDTLASKIAELAKEGRIQGIADIRDESSGRTGQRLVIVLKRDAVAKVVLNHLYKQTALQSNFSANMLALVDGIPRTLPISAFVRYWVEHQIDVILRRTQYRLRKAQERMHILVALLKALDMLDEVIALIRRSPTADEARTGLMSLLDIDEVQADAILDMQLRKLAALERQKVIDEHDELAARIEEYKDIIARPERQRAIVSQELDEVVEKWGDERRTQIVPYEGEMSMEDFIAEENVVVSITRGGYAKRTRVDEYRSQRRGGKGVRGASLRDDDIVEHFFVTTTHHWILFFTNLGRVYRAKSYELPEGARDAKGQHVANLLEFQPGENIAAVLAIPNYEIAPYLVIATRKGLVKKTRLSEYDSPRSGGLIAVNLREGDELIGVSGLNVDDGLLLVSRKGQSLRIRGDDETMRPMGRATSGVTGMKFRNGDELLAMCLIPSWTDPDVFVMFENGIAKRTPASDYPIKGRAGLGVKVAAMSDRAGDLVGALTVGENEEVMVVMEKGKVVRSRVDEVRRTGRNTMGVQFAKPDKGDAIVGLARNPEPVAEAEVEAIEEAEESPHQEVEPTTAVHDPAAPAPAADGDAGAVDLRDGSDELNEQQDVGDEASEMPSSDAPEGDEGGRQ